MGVHLRFVTSGDAVSDLIRRGCYGFWATHTEAAMPDGTLLGAHANGGVQARAADYDAGQWTQQLFIDLPATARQADAFHAFMRSQIGRPYDMRVIEAIAAGALLGERDWRAPDHWICSELVAAGLETAGIVPPLATGVNHITPRDVLIFCSARVTVGIPTNKVTS